MCLCVFICSNSFDLEARTCGTNILNRGTNILIRRTNPFTVSAIYIYIYIYIYITKNSLRPLVRIRGVTDFFFGCFTRLDSP